MRTMRMVETGMAAEGEVEGQEYHRSIVVAVFEYRPSVQQLLSSLAS